MKHNLSEFENEYTWGKAIVSNSADKFHADFDKAIDEVQKELGKKYPLIINGKEVYSDDCFTASSPSDTRIAVAEFPKASADDTQNAISCAKNAFEKWSNTTYQKRAEIYHPQYFCPSISSRIHYLVMVNG